MAWLAGSRASFWCSDSWLQARDWLAYLPSCRPVLKVRDPFPVPGNPRVLGTVMLQNIPNPTSILALPCGFSCLDP